MTAPAASPVLVRGRLDPGLSRWLWLVKWLLALPHVVVLVFLWIGFFFATVAALVAIVVTGRYPRPLFDYTVGVLRWSWRVGYYGYGALGTDRYPPFTLAEVPDYPATLTVAYPEQLSRGLALVKWWLLALPHYLVVGIFLSGGAWAVQRGTEDAGPVGGTGLISLLVLIAAVALAVTGRYPSGIFDLVLGLDRWVLRVAAYGGLMTDRYPPFRLDQGGEEPVTGDLPPGAPTGMTGEAAGGAAAGSAALPHERSGPSPAGGAGGTVALVLGVLLLLPSLGLLGGGAAALWADRTQRDAAGYVATDAERFSTSAPAIVTAPVDLHLDGPGWLFSDRTLGDVRVRATGTDDEPVFLGVGRTPDVEAWLTGVAHDEVVEISSRSWGGPGEVRYERQPGSAELPSSPDQADVWEVSDTGSGLRSVTWPVQDGSWTAVVANADGSAGVEVTADVGATAPALPWIALVLIVLGLALGVAAVTLIVVGAARLGRGAGR